MLITDQLHREIHIEHTPKRIISLVPSQTELLYDLGLEDRVVGITKFCIYPESWFKTKTHVGGTKKVNFETVAALNPDLIIGNKEENTENDIKTLGASYPVWMSDINCLNEAIEMIDFVGNITQTQDKAKKIQQHIKDNFAQLTTIQNSLKVLYFIWQKPYMAVGSDTFINDMLNKMGLENIVKNSRYPILEEEALLQLKPDIIFLSSEPYPFNKKHLSHYQSLFPKANILLVDGEYFSWYGSRLKIAPSYFQNLLVELNLRFNQ